MKNEKCRANKEIEASRRERINIRPKQFMRLSQGG